MFEYVDYPFRVNISVETYATKDDARKCLYSAGAKEIGREKMAFVECVVTINEFLNFAISGHTFCALFDYDPQKKYWFQKKDGQWIQTYPVYKNGVHRGAMKLCMKSDKYYRGTQTVFVDVDYTRFTNVQDYLNALQNPPTCVYMSYSDNQNKGGVTSRRFRLIYVFDRVLNKDEFMQVAKSITRQIENDTNEPLEDDCGTRMSQYMNGVVGNTEIYRSNIIYQVLDFPSLPSPPIKQESIEVTNSIVPEITFDEKMLNDMKTMQYEDFMHYNSWRGYKYRTEFQYWIDDLYQMTNENYLQIWFWKDKVKDGEHRRRKLYKNACLRRLMFPDMDANTLLFNLYVDFMRFFDNSDKVITLETLIRKVRTALTTPIEEIEEYCQWERDYWRRHRPKFIVKPGIRTTKGLIKEIKSRILYNSLDIKYDRSKTIQENLSSGIGVSQSTLYRYVKDRGIETKTNKQLSKHPNRKERAMAKQQDIERFCQLYDSSKSLRQNQILLKEYGLKLAVGTIRKWANLYGACNEEDMPQEQLQSPLKISFSVPKFGLGDWNDSWE